MFEFTIDGVAGRERERERERETGLSEFGMEARRRKSATTIARYLTVVFSIIVLALIPGASGIDDKCGACNAVAAELEVGLSKEKPRNHLDMRHRLDSKGQREGKVIDYKVSELRVVELLDGLCEKMQDYTLQKLDSGEKAWVKVKDWDMIKTDKQEARAYAKAMSSFCGRLLEETEEELAELIKQGSIKQGGVSNALCQDLSKHCSGRSESGYTHDGEL